MLHHVIVGEGKPILILHGSPLDHRHMMETLEPEFQHLEGWRRVYVDLPGHGHSPAQAKISTQDDLLASVIDFAEEIFAEEKIAIIGESRGSYLARGFVYLRPTDVSGVALIGPGGSPTGDPARLPSHQVLAPDPSIRAELEENEIGRFDKFMVVQNRDVVEKTRRSKLPAIDLWDAEQGARVNSAFDFSFDVRGEKSVFEGPSLIIAGRQDSISGYLDAIDLLPQFPRASLAVLDTAGHGLAWERPDAFGVLLVDWLRRLETDGTHA